MGQAKIKSEDVVSLEKAKVGLSNVSNDAQLKIASNLADVADSFVALANLRPAKTGIFAQGSNTYIFSDSDITEDSIVDVNAQIVPQGGWRAISANGSLTILSSKIETVDVPFVYFINNK